MAGGAEWKESDLTILHESYGKRTYAEMAVILGRTAAAVQGRASLMGLPATKRRDVRVATCQQCGRVFEIRKLKGDREKRFIFCSQKCNGESRRQVRYEFARRNGWPEYLGTRHVQVMNLLAAVGLPVTAVEMATALKLNLPSVREAVCRLTRWDLVLATRSARNGNTCALYCLSVKSLGILEERAKCEAEAITL